MTSHFYIALSVIVAFPGYPQINIVYSKPVL